MASVYKACGINETLYFNTSKEVMRHKFGGDEWPESIERCDAAGECNQLVDEIRQIEGQYYRVRLLLEELCSICPNDILAKGCGRRAAEFIEAHPLPPTTAADRDGGRSYGV